MGYDLPAAIGAAIADRRRRVVCLAGDGSIMMNIQDLITIHNYNLNILVFILENDGYLSIKQTQRNFQSRGRLIKQFWAYVPKFSAPNQSMLSELSEIKFEFLSRSIG